MTRFSETLAALLLLIALFPFFLITFLLITFSSKGGAFFLQERVGLNKKPFVIVKFRTMVKDAQNLGGYSTQSGDARITKVGKVIRKTSIDELPQLFNIINGTMSFVGPRPDLPEQLALYSEEQLSKRLSVLPGITGLAQSSLRSTATPQQRLALDLEYVEKKSFLFNFKIIGNTVLQVLSKGGN